MFYFNAFCFNILGMHMFMGLDAWMVKAMVASSPWSEGRGRYSVVLELMLQHGPEQTMEMQ